MKKSFILLAVLATLGNIALGQNTKRGDKAFENGLYYQAIQEYTLIEEKISGDAATSSQVMYKIAESYRRMNQPNEAAPYYEKAVKAGYMTPDIYFGYGDVLLKQGKYDLAKKQFESYKRSNPSDKLTDAKIASCAFAQANKLVNPKFKLQPVETLNTKGSEYGIAYFNDNLIYASTGNPVENAKSSDISPRTGLPYSKIYMSVAFNGAYNRGELAVGLNAKDAKVNEGTFAYDPIQNRGYYTRCEGLAKEAQCYIYFAEFKNNQWKEIDKLAIESRKERIGHPFMMPNGKRIYFVGVLEGGYGGSDIWYSDKLPDGTWSKPINLGREVNTAGYDGFPFVADGYLFFSSDGHPGYGGLDIYASKIDGNVHGEAINLGMPFNTPQDDLNLIERFDNSEGMLISTRRTANNDDIFKYDGFPSSLIAYGKIYDSITKEPLVGISVDVRQNGKSLDKLTSDEQGNYFLYIDPDSSQYDFSATVLRYNPQSKAYTAPKERFGTVKGWDLPMLSSVACISGIVTGQERQRDGSFKDLGPLVGAKVIVHENDEQIKVIETDAKGEYRFCDVKEGAVYQMRGIQDGYFSDVKEMRVPTINQSIDFCKAIGFDNDIQLEKIQDIIQIDKIYYLENKFNLLPESYPELNKLVDIMKKNPNLTIRIRSHTNSRGKESSNMKLSQNRAKAVVDYLISQGIPANKLEAKGYGETQLLIKPERTEADYAANRRSEFEVVKSDGEALYDTRMKVEKSVPQNYGIGVRTIMDGAPGGYYNQGGQYNYNTPYGGGQTTYTPPSGGTNYAPTTGGNVQNMPYRIQIAATSKYDLSRPEFIKIKQQFNLDVYAEQSGSVYRYFAGGFNTMDEAKAMADRVNRALGTQYFARAK
jgi:outer membrane protein OmpA-like peptidoglycan-associated protein